MMLLPIITGAYNNRGADKNKSGDYVGAITDYDQAIKLNPDDDDACENQERSPKKY